MQKLLLKFNILSKQEQAVFCETDLESHAWLLFEAASDRCISRTRSVPADAIGPQQNNYTGGALLDEADVDVLDHQSAQGFK